MKIIPYAEQAAAVLASRYPPDVVERQMTLDLHAVKDALAETGKLVLQKFPVMACACVPMSALWHELLLQRGIDAPQLAGDLVVRGRFAFAGGADPERAFSRSGVWDGHSWLSLGRYIADIAIFRTAYGAVEGSNLREAVLQEFGEGRGVLVMPGDDLTAKGFEYRPRYALTDEQAQASARGALALIEPQNPR
jgi:hypothetical protein